MESPISRTASSHSIYAPGPHRRSHPNLAHLSLAPLTPRYPIDPADYLAYHDPNTSTLHTSASISHIASLPSPSGILSNSTSRNPSRANSRTRLKRKVKSHVQITDINTSTPSGAVSSAGYGHSALRALSPTQTRTTKSGTRLVDANWLLQTGLALTESSRESKGQSWLGKRDSSTSLAGLVTAPTSPVEERGRFAGMSGLNVHAYVRSGRATPNRSRGNSRRDSRRVLAMTTLPDQGEGVVTGDGEREEVDIQPDWTDADTKAEVAASRDIYADEALDLEEDMFDEDDEDDDPYGTMNLAEHFDTGSDIVDEEEVRRELKSSGLGQWFDGVVDVMLMLEGEPTAGDEYAAERRAGLEALRDLANEDGGQGSGQAEKVAKRPAWDDATTEQLDVEAPPEQYTGVWDDVKWLGRLVARSMGS